MELWTEKYRPKSIDDVDCDAHIKKFVENATANGFPHLLFYGPPGTGKTTVAQLFNPTFQLNASDDRGIDTIRNQIKKIANTLKRQVIVLDECENLTKDSQTCLRRILEDYPNTSFIFCTNYYSKIIDPLKSRLLKIKFTLKESKALEIIGRKENMCIDYPELFRKCNGDLRKCLNVMQGVKPLKEYDLDDVVGVIKDHVIRDFLKLNNGNYKNFIKIFIDQCFSPLQLIHQLSKTIDREIGNDRNKCEFFRILSDAELKCINGCSDELVLSFICLNYISINSK